MTILAIDCATEACSIALFSDKPISSDDTDFSGSASRKLIAGELRMLGRGHAEYLVPMISELPGRGRADRIAVSLGPGSFTGVRIGLAAARALALAWDAELVGYPTLALIAAMAQADSPEHETSVAVCMTGGHGEYFMQQFGADGMPQDELVALSPEEAAAHAAHPLVAGTQAEALVKQRGSGRAMPLWPDAQRFNLLPNALLSQAIAPIYGRAPDARLPVNRA